MKTPIFLSQHPVQRKLFAWIFLLALAPLVLGSLVPNLGAVEPDSKLYSEQAAERDAAYEIKKELLAAKIAAATDEREKQSYLVEQQLLHKLKELPSKPEKPSLELHFSERDLKKTISWQDFMQYLERYINVIQEGKISAQNLETADKRRQTLYNQLIALAENDPEQNLLQLQYAFENRKFIQQFEIEKQLRKELERAKEQYPEILEHIHIDQETLDKNEQLMEQAEKNLQRLEYEKILATAGNDVLIQQQESLLAGYLGRELSEDEKKEMNYEQLKLLKLQVQQLVKDNQVIENRINLLEVKQQTTWFYLLGQKSDFFKLSNLSGDINKQISRLRKNTDKAHSLIYTYEKELSTLRGGNALVGPKAQELINTLDKEVRTVFTLLSGLDRREEMLEGKGRLLDRAIDLKQSAFGSMVTKALGATDDLFGQITSALKYPLISYSGMSLSLLLLLQILILLVSGIIINRLYGHLVQRMGKKRNWSEQTVHLIQAVGKYPFIFLVAMIILSFIGFNTRSLALVAGALSVGIGLGMQTIVNNLVSGIILLFDKSIRPGDYICLGDTSTTGEIQGNVVQMNIRTTVLRTNDNINIIIPNADLMASQVVNWTYSDEKIRFRIPFSVAYGSDIAKVKSVVKEAIVNLPEVLSQPETQIWMASHADSSLAFLAAIWVEGDNARRPAQITDIVLTTIYTTLSQHEIEIPFPQMDLRLRGSEQQSFACSGLIEAMQLKPIQQAAPQ